MKLVRDKIPQIITQAGKVCTYHTAAIPEYNIRLYDKMIEELTEFMEDPCVEEAADIYEVFLAMLRNWNISIADAIDAANVKRGKRGGFARGYVLERVGEPNEDT